MSIKIVVAKGTGFCGGVNNAIKRSLKIINHQDTCTYGEIVHNRFAQEDLKKQGIVNINSIEGIINNPAIRNVIIRAHGVMPEEEELLRKYKTVYDFTCPKVKKVQLLARRLTDEGYQVIIYGKQNHPEVIGIRGYTGGKAVVIGSGDDLDTLGPFSGKIALISQTTMNSQKFDELQKKLKVKYLDIEIYNTLCQSPIYSQTHAEELAGKVDAMLVIGDKKSANTNTLFEKIKRINENAFFIETVTDLPIAELKKFSSIGLTGGSSTPLSQIESIRDYLEKQF